MDPLLALLVVILAFLCGWQCCVFAFKKALADDYKLIQADIDRAKSILKETQDNNAQSREILADMKRRLTL